ncbi:MAG: single-stranded-DNA-specific exonuclease RecJ [Phycisphaerae bacterium]
MPRAWTPKTLNWNIPPADESAEQLARQIRTSRVVAQALVNRGISDADAARGFLSPKLNDLHDPEQLPGCVKAAKRIARAVEQNEKIVIYGDYDVDGMTSVAILHACLKMVDGDVSFYVPHRLDEGYGVNDEAVDKLIAEGMDLMVTVDCGVTAVQPVRKTVEKGVDVIITDHHAVGQALPPAEAIVHPDLPGELYPNPHMCGAGVAFKVAWQVAREVCGTKRVDDRMKEFLLNATCLAALGTIADVVPLVGENRSLAVFGLRGLPQAKHDGLQALLASANLVGETLDAFHVGFRLAPRLNACGRMGHAQLAVELLTDAPAEKAAKIAGYLSQQNTERQKVEREITARAIELVEERGLDGDDARVIVLAEQGWHAGVVGICASRLVDRFGKPAVIIAINGDGTGQGSARSVEGFHMRDALQACGEHLLSFGGHAMAGGLRVAVQSVEAFTKAMEAHARQHVSDEQIAPSIDVDVETNLEELSYVVVEHLSRFQPCGQGNPHPRVAMRGLEIIAPPRRIGRSGKTATMVLGQAGQRMRAVGFGMGDLADRLVGIKKVDVVAEPVLNTFRGRTNAELQLIDVRWDG